MIEYKRKILRTIIDKDLSVKSHEVVKKEKPKVNSSSFQYLNIGFYLITPLLLGVFLGINLDQKFGSKPVFVCIGIIFGVISTFYNLFRLTKK